MASKALTWLEQAASAERTAQVQATAVPTIPAAALAADPSRHGWSVMELVKEWTAVQSQVHEHLRVTHAWAVQVLPGQHQRHVEAASKAQEEARGEGGGAEGIVCADFALGLCWLDGPSRGGAA